MDTNRKLGEVAANLDDMSDTIEELKDAMQEGDAPSAATIDELQQGVAQAADTIDDVVDPGPPRKS